MVGVKWERGGGDGGAFYRVHFLAVSSLCENRLTGTIMQDSLVHCRKWIVLFPANLIFATLTLLHLLKPKLLR